MALLGVFLAAIRFTSSSSSSSGHPGLKGSADVVPDSVLESQQNYLSLLMQAAADRPVNFADFGISNQTYRQLRQLLLTLRDDLSEDSHWQLHAELTKVVDPSTQACPTLGDHLVSLDLLAALLKPLYPTQPTNLDVDQTVTTLASHIDLNNATPMDALFQALMDVVPESTGASRLQRIVLVRSAIARAVVNAQPA